MVEGLDRFRKHFSEYTDCYILIGGTACALVLEPRDTAFRRTKDFDIVLCLENADAGFVGAFWDFIHRADYRQKEVRGKPQCYRFSHSPHKDYPHMLELFSRTPDALEPEPVGGHLVRIPTCDGVSGLSAILLDDTYYEFLRARRMVKDGLCYAPAECLIPLKALAWLKNTELQKNGAKGIKEGDIRKHKADVFALVQVLNPTPRSDIPGKIKADLRKFISDTGSTLDHELACSRLRTIYGLD
jgi:hypothetical protein